MVNLKKFGVHVLTYRHELSRLLEYGVKLEKWGFDHLTVGDHTLTTNAQVQYPNAHVILSAIGTLTNRITLSTAVTDSYRRHPVEIAQSIATLDRLTKGRIALGIGAGAVLNLGPFGIEWKKPYTTLKEAIEVIKLLWHSSPNTPVDFQGEIFKLDKAYLQIKCCQKPHPPIYVGGISPKTRELIGEVGDGWFPLASETPKALKVHLEDIKKGAAKIGRGMEDYCIFPTIYTVIGDFEEAYKIVEPFASSVFLNGWLEDDILQMLGIERSRVTNFRKIRADDVESLRKLAELARALPRSLVEQIVAIGSPDQCIARLEEYLKAGANCLLICSLDKDDDKLYQTYSEKILPYLKETYSDHK